MNHTPGPWNVLCSEARGRPRCLVVDAKDNEIASINPFRESWNEDAELIATAPEMRELLECVAMIPIALESDGECYIRIKTETMFKIACLVFGTQITEIQTLAGQLVNDKTPVASEEQ